MPDPDTEIRIEHLGRMAYEPAWQRQQQVHAAVVAGESPETILLVEHDPVITIGRRPDAAQHLLADERMLAHAGVELAQTNRGGDITYHGPGQIVAYPIIRLNDRQLNLRQYVWQLEQAIIDTLGEFTIAAGRDDCAVGVWVDGRSGSRAELPGAEAGAAKIAAIGVRASRWVTLHGLALNVTTDLDHFKLIVPCGLAGRSVTSMAALLGEQCPAVDDVRDRLCSHLMHRLQQASAGDASVGQRR